MKTLVSASAIAVVLLVAGFLLAKAQLDNQEAQEHSQDMVNNSTDISGQSQIKTKAWD